MRFWLTADIGGTKMAAALFNGTKLINRIQRPTEPQRGSAAVISSLCSLLLEVGQGDLRHIAGVGIACPGPLSPSMGVVIKAPMLGWDNVPLAAMIREQLDLPVLIAHDAQAAAYGEYRLGAGKGAGSMAYITVSTGVGCGLVLGGKPVYGAHEAAGELGHLVIHPDGRPCACGRFGCLEAYASGTAIGKAASAIIPGLTAMDAELQAIAGDERFMRLFDDAGDALGLGIAALRQILDVERVVIGGSVSNAFSLFYPALKRRLLSSCYFGGDTEEWIRRAELGADNGLYGAGFMAMEQLGQAATLGENVNESMVPRKCALEHTKRRENAMNIQQMQKALHIAREKEGFSTLLGIGPMSPMLLKATLELSKEQDFPVLFIASRNQVDIDEFGGGYVSGWDQTRFVAAIKAMAESIGYDGQYYICRDHGGPWQRDEERKASLPENEAMARGLQSYFADLDAGFDLLHIDPTKDPAYSEGTVPMDVVLQRTVELIEKIEAYRLNKGLPEIGYEVGTEETNGGLTGVEAFEEFISRLCGMLKEKGLPSPNFIVGQTGTLTRLTENVGHYSTENAAKLSAIAAAHGMELKEHNGDYLPDQLLLLHPALKVSSSNVAPEFGVDETMAYLELAALEEKLYDIGVLKSASGLVPVLRRTAVETGRWRKWMVGEEKSYDVETVLADEELTSLITKISGHYTFETPAVAEKLAEMLDALEAANVPARRFVLDKIKRSIGKYVTAYHLRGLTGRLRKYAE